MSNRHQRLVVEHIRDRFPELPRSTRRCFLRHSAFAAALLAVPGAFAEELATTPQMTEGPFYPDRLPLDTDNDLLILNDAITPAVGQITHVAGRLRSRTGQPVRGAFVEIWQCDNNGSYLHSDSGNRDRYDSNFQGYGRCLTDAAGRYYFRTIKPVPYPGRTPHIHFAVSLHGRRVLTTQLFVEGHPQNATDGLLRRITDPVQRALIIRPFQPLPDSKLDELTVDFDLILGLTPDETQLDRLEGGIARPQSRRG
ncbi:MAG: protocatechuate 3,4-dioxygenase subunit beta [Pirellulaceae bacterium]|nr:MAG: protocatechuate 3,4-dioxygenase subunit beta [Pirellulaceae bacterium]